jgi:hypothetical protein
MLTPPASQRSGALTLPATATYRAERPFWPWRGREFHIYDPSGALVGYVHNPVLALRDEVVIYTDTSQTRPLAKLQARQIISLQMTYDVIDPTRSASLGALRTRGLRSLLRWTWDILDAEDRPIGAMVEGGWAPLRRLFPLPLGRWAIERHGQTAGEIRQVFHFFRREYVVELSSARIDPRFGIACAVLVLMAETSRGL